LAASPGGTAGGQKLPLLCGFSGYFGDLLLLGRPGSSGFRQVGDRPGAVLPGAGGSRAQGCGDGVSCRVCGRLSAAKGCRRPAFGLEPGCPLDRVRHQSGGRTGDPGAALCPLVDLFGLVSRHRPGAAVGAGSGAQEAGRRQKAGGLGGGFLPGEPGAHLPAPATVQTGAFRKEAAVRIAGRREEGTQWSWDICPNGSRI